MKKMTLLLILGNLASFGPFVTDFYLPCLPKLADWFSTSTSLVQMSLTASMIGLAVGQLLIGPVADKYGRRRPLLWCLAFFVVATVGCIVSPKIHWFVFFRLLQGVTGASGLVISKAMVADLYTGSAMGKFFAALTAIQFISPILAPLLGGVIFNLASWQGIFIVLGMWGLLLLCAGSRLSETLAVEKRLQLPIRKSLTAFLPVLRNRRFMVMNLFQAFVSAVFFSYISASPFLFQHQFGLSPMNYGFCFAFNAIGLIMGSMLVVRLKQQQSCLMPGTIDLLLTCGLTSFALLAEWPFIVFEVTLFFMIFSCGMLIPIGNTLALDSERENKGIAAALLGAVAFLFGGLAAPLVGLGNLIYSTVILFMTGALMALFSWLHARQVFNYTEKT